MILLINIIAKLFTIKNDYACKNANKTKEDKITVNQSFFTNPRQTKRKIVCCV